MVFTGAGAVGKLPHAVAILRLYRDPAVRFLDYFGLLKRGSVHSVRLRNGLRFQVRAGFGDLSTIDEVFIHGVYDQVLSRIRPGQQVVDIGSHCGVFALAAAARGARVSCFEPMTENVTALQRNVAANRLSEAITVRPVAVAGSPGEVELYARDFDSGGSTAFPTIHPEWAGRGDVKKVKVECVTLGDVLKSTPKRCDCVKMDCEGAEYDILRKASDEDLERIESIIMEYHPNGRIDEIGDLLERVGFSVEVSPGTNIMFAWKGQLA